MKPSTPAPATVEAYIATFPAPVQAMLQQVRAVIRQAAPEAVERISYGIPTFALHGNLIHFAAFGAHVGLYPGSSAIVAFARELTGFRTAKGTVRLPLDQPVPVELLRRIVAFRVDENTREAAERPRRTR